MSRSPIVRRARRPTLLTVLQRVQMRVALIAVLLVGASIFAVGLLALRVYMVANLDLVAGAISYTVEAAVVFRDRPAAAESLALVASNNAIAEVQVVDGEGHPFVAWKRVDNGLFHQAEQAFAAVVLPGPVVSPIKHDGVAIGEVRVYGYGRDLLTFMVISAGSALLGLVLSSVVAYRLSRRAGREIILPLQDLAQTAYAVRRERRFQRRVAPASIAELHELGDDFNALLDELESWHAQWKQENASLEYQANHDLLTGLCNRAFFENRLQLALRVAEESGHRVAVLFLDSDNLKSINDELGHEAGDTVLREIATRLKSLLRDGAFVARMGGDEFAVLLAPMREAGHAAHVAAKIIDHMMAEIPLPSGDGLTTSLSVGVAIYPDHASDAAALMKRADAAMYHAKRKQRGSCKVADDCDSI
jgi:diguanylate cyclase (GGDEF)-like protein